MNLKFQLVEFKKKGISGSNLHIWSQINYVFWMIYENSGKTRQNVCACMFVCVFVCKKITYKQGYLM